MGILKRLRARFSVNQVGFDPAKVPTVAIVREQKAAYGAEEPAPWTDDITKHNAQIAADYHAELARRTALFERGEYQPRFGSVENDMMFEMRTANVTTNRPRFVPLTPLEAKQGAQVAGLRREISAEEYRQMDKSVDLPRRPSKEQVLDAAGGDEFRAAQVEAKLDALYGATA